MRTLNPDQLHRLKAVRMDLRPSEVTEEDVATLVREWEAVIEPDRSEKQELFSIVDMAGSRTGVVGPRWLFHRFGLPHRAVHVGLTAPGGLVLLQRRSRTKTDNPALWEIAASGHVAESGDGSEVSIAGTALRELGEELFSLAPDVAGERVLRFLSGPLQLVGTPYGTWDEDEQRNPPHYNAEFVQVFAGTLNEQGIVQLSPDLHEVAGVYLCPTDEAWLILEGTDVAPGCRNSLPRYLDWLAEHDPNP